MHRHAGFTAIPSAWGFHELLFIAGASVLWFWRFSCEGKGIAWIGGRGVGLVAALTMFGRIPSAFLWLGRHVRPIFKGSRKENAGVVGGKTGPAAHSGVRVCGDLLVTRPHHPSLFAGLGSWGPFYLYNGGGISWRFYGKRYIFSRWGPLSYLGLILRGCGISIGRRHEGPLGGEAHSNCPFELYVGVTFLRDGRLLPENLRPSALRRLDWTAQFHGLQTIFRPFSGLSLVGMP